jgi:hypothetical protein
MCFVTMSKLPFAQGGYFGTTPLGTGKIQGACHLPVAGIDLAQASAKARGQALTTQPPAGPRLTPLAGVPSPPQARFV